ncbi:MAG: hypothetical protein LBH30_03500 [Prevotellaceae bacterium]|nr:hypothetical protein [Prevotellaceae bacterium]
MKAIIKICLAAFFLTGLTSACLATESDDNLQTAKETFALIDVICNDNINSRFCPA